MPQINPALAWFAMLRHISLIVLPSYAQESCCETVCVGGEISEKGLRGKCRFCQTMTHPACLRLMRADHVCLSRPQRKLVPLRCIEISILVGASLNIVLNPWAPALEARLSLSGLLQQIRVSSLFLHVLSPTQAPLCGARHAS